MKPYIKAHIVRVLTNYQKELAFIPQGSLLHAYKIPPFELFLKKYIKNNLENLTNIDNHDIIYNSFQLLRFKELLDNVFDCKDWSERLENSDKIEEILKENDENHELPNYVQCSIPKDLFTLLSNSYSEEDIIRYCEEMLYGKPQTFIRANHNKINREELMMNLNKRHRILSKKTVYSPIGLKILEKEGILSNLYRTPAFFDGLFETQNEASQLSLLKIKPKKGDRILDYRCKLGDKSLTLSSITQGLEIVLFDEKESLLETCNTRFQRAGVSGYKIIDNYDKILDFERKFDWVLLEVPSSETGLFRERPENKLKFTRDGFEALIRLQRRLLEESVRFLKPGSGKLAYFTNSLLKDENIEQISWICNSDGLELRDGKYFQSFPNEEGMIGHFSAILQQKTKEKHKIS